MDNIAIRAEGIGKQYRIGQQRERYYTLRESLIRAAKTPFRRFQKLRGKAGGDCEMFWALKDVSLEVKQGEVLGIIGRNGAGKSTLLKILCRVTRPTTGFADLYGRVGSLLEVGTGFHPELTGRENIYLSGATLGMRKAEIATKFDEIVDFSGVEKFLDTPAKHYSSGMYVRLAFAVAAHFDSEILILDEVLAVGDADFQKKCFGKMSQVTKSGRTILLVSHNLESISALTNRALWLDKGVLRSTGPSPSVVREYMSELSGTSSCEKNGSAARRWEALHLNNNPLQILSSEIRSDGEFLDVRREFRILIRYVVREPIAGAVVQATIHSLDGSPIISTEDSDMNIDLLNKRVPGHYVTEVVVPGDWLSPGEYVLRLHSGVVFKSIYDNIEVLAFGLLETGSSRLRAHKKAYILPYLKWTYELIDQWSDSE
ncbi:MAG: polysaccharide ABC transporter ATP-binding protein [Desulfomonilaceae bacterium]